MENPQKRGADVLRNLMALRRNLSACEAVLRLQFVDLKVSPENLHLLRCAASAFGMIAACCEIQSIDFETAKTVHGLCQALRLKTINNYGFEVPKIADRCEKLSLEVLADIPINLEITSDTCEQVSASPCKSSKFCDFLGCAGICNRSVSDD